MRVLYVTSGLPFPLTSGKLRHYFLARGLAERHSVTLLALISGAVDPEHLREIERFATVRLEPEETTSSARMKRVVGVSDGATRRIAAYVRNVFAEDAADALVISGRRAYPLFLSLRGSLPLIYDLCDARSLHMSRSFNYAPARQKPAIALRFLLSRWRERAVLAGAGAVMFGSPRDRRAVLDGASRHAGQTVIVPNGVDLEFWQRSNRRLGSEIVFTGVMDYAPNIDAALQLVDVILPQVRQALPDARLRIVGRDPPEQLLQRGSQGGVTVTGFVDDVRPHLEEAAVFAAPLRFGAGIQNKVLEAMAMEVPCVVSPLAAAGLEVGGGVGPPLEVVQQPERFAALLVKQLGAAEEDPQPQPAARAYVERHFSWPSAVTRLEVVLSRLARAQDSSESVGDQRPP